MKIMYEVLVARSGTKFNKQKVIAYIKVIKRLPDGRKKERLTYRLFVMLSKIIVKGVNNFLNLVKNAPSHKIIHTTHDIIGECYLIFNKCLEKLNMAEVDKFYFYLNSALNRGMYRLFEQNYKNICTYSMSSECNDAYLLNIPYHHHFDLTEVDLSCLNVLEIEVVKHKVSGGKLQPFLKEEELTMEEYNITLSRAVQKIRNVYNIPEPQYA